MARPAGFEPTTTGLEGVFEFDIYADCFDVELRRVGASCAGLRRLVHQGRIGSLVMRLRTHLQRRQEESSAFVPTLKE